MALESNKTKTQLVRRVTATGQRRGTRLSPSKASKTKDVQATVLPIQEKTLRRTSPRKLSAVNDVADKEEEEELKTKPLSKPTRTSPRHEPVISDGDEDGKTKQRRTSPRRKAVTSDDDDDGKTSKRKLIISEEDNQSLSVSCVLEDASINISVDNQKSNEKTSDCEDIAEAIPEIAFEASDSKDDDQASTTEIELSKDLLNDLNKEHVSDEHVDKHADKDDVLESEDDPPSNEDNVIIM